MNRADQGGSRLQNIPSPQSKSGTKRGNLGSPNFAGAKSFYDDGKVFIANNPNSVASFENVAKSSVVRITESSDVLMKMLHGVANVHPFVGVAVLALEAVIQLELKRRSNNKKVKALLGKRDDMVRVLLSIKDMQSVGQDGKDLKNRLHDLIERVAKSIKDCGSACDAYDQQSSLGKLLKSPFWDSHFVQIATGFDNIRKDIQFELNLHSAHKIGEVHDKIQDMEKKFEDILNSLGSKFDKVFAELVESRGGHQAVVGDYATLKEFATIAESKNIERVISAKTSKLTKPVLNTEDPDPFLLDLKEELEKDVKTCLEDNREKYEHKVELLNQQIKEATEELKNEVRREGDLVIEAIISGPYQRIKNEDLRNLWKEMGWKGSVDSHRFILDLHDHFNEKFRVLEEDYAKNSSHGPSPTLGKHRSVGEANGKATATPHQKRRLGEWTDRWAYAYINVLRIWSLREEFDDDSTGFVTINEVNTFSSSRPKDWSLTYWMAYWAAGWHATVWFYRSKLIQIIREMWGSLDEVHPFNRRIVDRYLSSKAFRRIDILLRSVNPYHNEDHQNLWGMIHKYVEDEEDRLKRNLVSFRYDIDTLDTLWLITGPGRIEKYIFPLLYLILQRHLQIIKIAKTKYLSIFELYRPRDLPLIFESVDERISILTVLFKQQHIDVAAQLDSFAFGMFKFLHAEVSYGGNVGMGYKDDDNTHDDQDASESSLDVQLLKFPFREEELDHAAYDILAHEAVSTALGKFSDLKGVWTGLYFSKESRPERLMKIAIHNIAAEGTFLGSGKDGTFAFTISGRIEHSDNGDIATVEFTKQYHPLHDRKRSSIYHRGNFDSSAKTIIGRWGASADSELAGEFRLGRYPAFAHPFRYSKDELVRNPARARWLFAGAAIRYQVRQRLGLLSWTFLKYKGTNKRRLLELYKRREQFKTTQYLPGDELTKGESAELKALEESMPADAKFYRSVAISEVRRMCIHFNAKCDVCSARIVGSRIICLVCVTTTDEINLCATCIDLPITRGDFIHDATHDIVKISGRIVHDKEKALLIQSAKAAIDESKASTRRLELEDHLDQLAEDSETLQAERITPGWYCNRCPESESRKLVSPPYWFCVRCAVFICDHCEETNAASSNEDHKREHPLVRVRYDQQKAISTEIRSFEARVESKLSDRLDRLEKRLHSHESYMNDRFESLESKVEGRLAKLEGILLQVASQFGGNGGPEANV